MSVNDLPQIYEWLMERAGGRITRRDKAVHRRVLVDGDFSNLVARDLDLILQGVRYARAAIAAEREAEAIAAGGVE